VSPWPAAAVGALVAVAIAAVLPRAVSRLPEPAPSSEVPEGEPPKVPYTELAGTAALRVWGPVVSALVAAALAARLGWSHHLLVLVPVVPVGVALAYIDWRTRLLPRLLVLPATAVAVVAGFVGWFLTGSADDLVRALIGMAATFGLYWLLWWVHASGMGFGDVRLSALLGFALGHVGWSELAVGVYLPFLLLGIPGLVLALVRRDRSLLKTAFPFGPAMLVGALLAVLVGEPLVAGLVAG
jgi:leader peptidase (prepilin peptidase)/N-methyltransferase